MLFSGKNIILTGGAGFIGSHLADALLAYGANCTIIDNLATSDGSNLPAKARFLKLDIGKDSIDEFLPKTHYVFHLASIARTQESFDRPLACNETHVTGTLKLLEACRQKGKNLIKFIYASSCAIYGAQKKVPIREDAPINHGTPYAFQKWIGEEYVRLYSKLHNLPTVSLRYSNTYGTKRQSELGGYPNVLASFSRQKKESGKLLITSDGKQTRDFIHVHDVVEATIKVALSPLADGRALNISQGVGTSINEVASYFACPLEYVAARPGEARHLVLDNREALKLLDWKPKISLEKGLQIYFNS